MSFGDYISTSAHESSDTSDNSFSPFVGTAGLDNMENCPDITQCIPLDFVPISYLLDNPTPSESDALHLAAMSSIYDPAPSPGPATSSTSESPLPDPSQSPASQLMVSRHRRQTSQRPLIALDAPVRSRRDTSGYKSAAAARGRKSYSGDEYEEGHSGNTPDETVMSPEDARRLQNTLAARKSRQRKQDYVRNLEDTVDRLSREVNVLRDRSRYLEKVIAAGSYMSCRSSAGFAKRQ